MDIIIEHPQILWWILSFIALGFIFGFKIFPYVVNKLCLDELTWLVQKTILKSYFVFKYSAFAVISIYIVVGFYYIFFLKEIVLGLILLGFTGFLIYTTYQSEKKGKSIKQFFDFLKYSTPVSFYNKQNDEDRRASFSSVVERIKRTELTSIKNDEYKKYLQIHFLSNIEQVLTFEYYDAKLYNSISEHYTATLFYRKFLKNVLEVLSRIDKRTDGLNLLRYNYEEVAQLLLNIKLLDFDDLQGYHYEIKSLDNKIDELLKDNSLEELKHLLKFKADPKIVYPLFKKYLELRYKNSEKLPQFKSQFIHFVNFFSNPDYYEKPYINGFGQKDAKYLIGFFSYLSVKRIAIYKVSDLVFLVLKISGHEAEGNNTSYEQAHRNSDFKLSETEEKSINSVYNRLFSHEK